MRTTRNATKRLVCHLLIITVLMIYGIVTIGKHQTQAFNGQQVSVTLISEDGERRETYYHIWGIEYYSGLVRLQSFGGPIEIDPDRFDQIEVTKEEDINDGRY